MPHNRLSFFFFLFLCPGSRHNHVLLKCKSSSVSLVFYTILMAFYCTLGKNPAFYLDSKDCHLSPTYLLNFRSHSITFLLTVFNSIPYTHQFVLLLFLTHINLSFFCSLHTSICPSSIPYTHQFALLLFLIHINLFKCWSFTNNCLLSLEFSSFTFPRDWFLLPIHTLASIALLQKGLS